MSDQINLVMLEFKNRLIRALEATSKLLPRMEEDDRLKPILLNVEKQYIGRNYDDIGDGTGSITAREVDSVRLFFFLKMTRHAPMLMLSFL
jgi:DNA primase large subunit